MRKQTGTVPKATTTTPKQQTNHLATATTPLQTMGVMGQTAAASRCSPLNIVASMQQQQQQQQQQNQRHIHQQQHKNTEIVAPIRRELKDLNDYLLTAVTHNNNNNNSNNYQQQQQHLQHPPDNTGGTNNSDLENSQENQQRFCYPVRPIPRRSRADGEQQQSQNDLQANSLGNLSTNINAAIGVVIPTTPSVTIISSTPATLPTLTSAITTGPTNSKTNNHQSSAQAFNWNQQLHNKLLLLQLQQIQQLFKEPAQANALLNLTNWAATNFIPTSVLNHNANELQNLLQLNTNQQRNNSNSLTNISSNRLSKSLKASDMVHEVNPNSSQREIVVNSTSLEDVASSDRAQSINSLHSNCETPTPDQSPTLEELQDRLVTSTRNIMNMQEQTEQLKHLQSTAKLHLNEMEKMRQQSNTNESNILDKICNGNDLDQSVEQIHSDMSLLVNRMKYLTTFIQHQNELSALLGDDGPESQAEQEALQRKLEDLRHQRDEMRQLVSELQDVNRTAEESAKEGRQRQLEQEKDVVETEPVAATVKTSPTTRPVYNSERVVPIEYTRTLPIELIQELVPHTARLQEDEQACLSAEALQQRESDIEAMKAQLKRLKEMMETVNMIESHTSRDPKLIGQEINRERSAAVTMPVEGKPVVKNSPDTVEDISRKVRILDEVTTDLKVQAESLQAERNRIEALKAEIERRKQQAAAAAQLGEEALKRSSLTPTPAIKVAERNITSEDADRQQAQEDRERLKSEYEVKKKEFEILCQRLDQEEATDHTQTPSTRQEIVSEADDEAEDICDSDYLGSGNNNNNINTANNNNNNKFSARASTPVACGRGLLREVTESASLRQNLAKDSISSSGAVLSSNVTQVNQAGNSSQDGASLEGASLLSGSCRSFSMPPPMTEMGLNFPGPLPPPLPTAWNAQQYYYSIPIAVPPPLPLPASTSNFNIKEPSTMPPSSGECICNGNNLGAATSSSTTSAITNLQLTSDPMLQQFIHTQQMLINSVCQCNQMLWHQQREIDSLNHTIRTLQDRILALTAGHQVASTTGAVTFNSTDIDYNIRSESVPLPPPPPPPPTLTTVNMSNIPSSGHNSATLPNNLYMSSHRVHSEQPIAFGAGPRRMAPESYHNYPEQQKHHQQQEQQQQYVHLYHHNRRDYNFCTESQQYNASATNNQTNNQSVVNGQTSTTSALHYNNDIPNSSRQHSSPPPPPPPLVNASPVAPAPIFMHHHNNSIHQNNANLRTQNQQQHRSNINNLTTAAGGNTLNNQVPPGNRANNYWDNFRSYSRQNLLSTNSNKSNEEQQQQQQQQQQDNEYATTRMTNGLMHRHQAPAPPSLASHTRMLCQQQQQQQHLDEISNNLNFDNNNMNSGYNKYLRVMERSRINQQQQRQYQQQSSYQQQQQQQQQQSDSSQHLSWLQQEQHHQQQQQQHIINTNDGSNNITAAATTTTTAATMYHNYNNINQGNKVSAKQISQLHNRNEDFNVPATAEQLRRTATTNERYHNTSERDDSYFLNSPLNQRQQQDADYMLRPFQGMEDNTYDFNNCNEQLQQHHSYITMEVSNNSTNTHNRRDNKNNDNNEDDDDDEEDTTTSEEIKRNLLVNALKNDKFTTKFYESIKEDVFRRLESMLLDKNNRSTVVASCSNSGNTGQQFLNNITNANNTRKMYLNAERRLHKQETGQQPKMETSNINSINDDYDYQLSVSTVAGEDNSTLMAVVEVEHDENEKPEEDCNDWCDDAITSLNNCSPRAVSTDTNVSATNANLRCSVHGITKNVTKKRKNQRKQDTNYNNNNTNSCNNNIGVITKSQQQQQQNETLNENLRGACSLAAQEHQQQKQKQNEDQLNEEKVGEEKNLICSSSSTPSTSTASSTPTNYSNTIITSIITKLRHHLHQDNNHINDARLSEIAKLTASVAQSSSFNNNGYNVSAKRIYAKMKKLSFPRKRDEFLHWYQNYLQTNLFLINNNAITGGGSKTNNNNNDDRDLAEADQNCSTANQQNANYTQNEARDSCKDKSKLVAAEFENQEIPDVENHNKKDSEGACALFVSQQPPQSQEIVKDFKTEKESNEQKINTDVNASLNDDN